MILKANIVGSAVCASGVRDLAHWREISRGEASLDPAFAKVPRPQLLPPREARRAGSTVQLAVLVAERACADAGLDPATPACVFASQMGDLATTDYLGKTLAADPSLLSPTRFHNSVHNAPSGYWSIAAGATATVSAMAAGQYSCANGLLEAMLMLQERQAPVLFVAYDLAATGPMKALWPLNYFAAVGLVLAPAAERAQLNVEITNEVGAGVTPATVLADHPAAPALQLTVELVAADSGQNEWPLSPTTALTVRYDRTHNLPSTPLET